MLVQLDHTAVAAQVPALLRTLAGPAALPTPSSWSPSRRWWPTAAACWWCSAPGGARAWCTSWPPGCCATPVPAPPS